MRKTALSRLMLSGALTIAIVLVCFVPQAADLFGYSNKQSATPTPNLLEQASPTPDSRIYPSTPTPGLPGAASNLPANALPLDIVKTIAMNKDLQTLNTALIASGVLPELRGEGPFTIFAPTNEAFNKLPAGKLESLMQPNSKDQLAEILRYHVTEGRRLSEDLKSTPTLRTLSGQDLAIKQSGNTFTVGGSTVTAADIMATNGVIHKIDIVLMPPEKVPGTPIEQPQGMSEPEPVSYPVPN